MAENAENNTDLISILPDGVLTHTLSFLTSREAVQKCVLAKQWRKIWAFVPVIQLNLDEFLTDSQDLESIERLRECEDKFQMFINNVIKDRKCSTLDTFECTWCIYDNYSEASMEWLDQVALLNPRAVGIFLFRKNVLEVLPELVFSCERLEELELSLYTDDLKTVIRPRSINLPRLNCLELASVALEQDFSQKLFSGCPALEILYLSHCELGFSKILSKGLKTLHLDECDQITQIQICCPGLTYLNIESNWQTKGLLIKHMTCIEQADIILNTADKLPFDGNLTLFGGLSNVSVLKLDLRSADLKESLKKNIPYSITFNYLKTLELGRLNMKDGYLVALFLQCSPQLQELTLNLNKVEDSEKEPSQEEPGVFKREYLDTVKILQWSDDNIIEWEPDNWLLEKIMAYMSANIENIGKIITS